MSDKPENIALYYDKGGSDKVYNIWLKKSVTGVGWVVDFSYGKRGKALNSSTKTTNPTSWAMAQYTYDKLISDKKKKGYKEDTRETARLTAEEEKREEKSIGIGLISGKAKATVSGRKFDDI
jgi:bifunctional non-homologous end joining protein LigD